MIEFTIKTLDSCNHQFSVDDEITVGELKEQVREQIGIQPNLQRLIFCGRVLQDEKRLSEYNVNGKVMHLVQRAPPSPGSRRSASATATSHSTRDSPTHTGRLGPSVMLPELQEPPVVVRSSTTGRLDLIRRMISDIRADITTLKAIRFNTGEASGSSHQPTPENWFHLNREHTGAGASSDPYRILPEIPQRPTRTRQLRSSSRPRDLGVLLDELEGLQDEFAPFRSNYAQLLRDSSTNPDYSDEERNSLQRQADLVSDVMHSFAHAYHAVSDISFTVGQHHPRLTSEATYVREPFPLQAHINVVQTSRGPQAAAAENNPTTTSNNTVPSQSFAFVNSPLANPQTAAAVAAALRQAEASRNASQHTANVPDPITYQVEIDTGVPIAFALDQNVLNNLASNVVNVMSNAASTAANASGNATTNSTDDNTDNSTNGTTRAATGATTGAATGAATGTATGTATGATTGATSGANNDADAAGNNEPAGNSASDSAGNGADNNATNTAGNGVTNSGGNAATINDEAAPTAPHQQAPTAAPANDRRPVWYDLEDQLLRAVGGTGGVEIVMRMEEIPQGALGALGLGGLLSQGAPAAAPTQPGNNISNQEPTTMPTLPDNLLQNIVESVIRQGLMPSVEIMQNVQNIARSHAMGQPIPTTQNRGVNVRRGPTMVRQHQAASMAMPSMVYDRFLHCHNQHADRRLLRRRERYYQQVAMFELERAERAAAAATNAETAANAFTAAAETAATAFSVAAVAAADASSASVTSSATAAASAESATIAARSAGNAAIAASSAATAANAAASAASAAYAAATATTSADAAAAGTGRAQRIETLPNRIASLTTAQMSLVIHLLDGPPDPVTRLNAILLTIARQLFLNEGAQNGSVVGGLPNEFCRLRRLMRNSLQMLMEHSVYDEFDPTSNVFNNAADLIVSTNRGFINRIGTLARVRSEVDLFRSIRSLLRARLPVIIAVTMSDFSAESYVTRFYATITRLFKEICMIITYTCEQGVQGLRTIFTAFLSELLTDVPDPFREALTTLGTENLNAITNIVTHNRNIHKFIVRHDEIPVQYEPADYSDLELSPMVIDESPASSEVEPPMPPTPPRPPMPPMPSRPPTPPMPSAPQLPPVSSIITSAMRFANLISSDSAMPGQSIDLEDTEPSTSVPTSTIQFNPLVNLANAAASLSGVPVGGPRAERPRGSATVVSGQASQSYMQEQPHTSASHIRYWMENSAGAGAAAAPHTSTSASSSTARDEPSPSHSMAAVLNNFDTVWAPVFEGDRHAQRNVDTEQPFSDAYMSGMPSKKRRRLCQNKQHSSADSMLEETVHEVYDHDAPLPEIDTALRSSLRDYFRDFARVRAGSDSDFEAERYPATVRLITQETRKRRTSDNEDPTS